LAKVRAATGSAAEVEGKFSNCNLAGRQGHGEELGETILPVGRSDAERQERVLVSATRAGYDHVTLRRSDNVVVPGR
jgi:hypothetical protein